MKRVLAMGMLMISFAVLIIWKNQKAGLTLDSTWFFITNYFFNLRKEDFLSIIALISAWIIYEIKSRKQEKRIFFRL
ncbi:hypothetical protein JOC77_003147 [Peribacillus deserti]|uniref:Uncharacterized protein n=1 Tax=Peribacillus deserti TaxID=673318 RepID=A0ABS2QKM3_9BACI|nr:hypothetical protein [Peribacillus deserti]MBM7693703.1 hypothetical protein [Peribacillus deserti]